MRTFLFKKYFEFSDSGELDKIFLSKVLVAIMFGGAEQLKQFGLRALGGTCV